MNNIEGLVSLDMLEQRITEDLFSLIREGRGLLRNADALWKSKYCFVAREFVRSRFREIRAKSARLGIVVLLDRLRDGQLDEHHVRRLRAELEQLQQDELVALLIRAG